MEHIIVSNIWKHLHKHDIILHFQHGFQPGLSSESQLIETVHDWMMALGNKTQTDAILLDFAKAFDKVRHKRLLSKLSYLKLCKCVKHYLKLFKIVLLVIGVYINIYCSSVLTFTNQTALGGDYFVTRFLPSLNKTYAYIMRSIDATSHTCKS